MAKKREWMREETVEEPVRKRIWIEEEEREKARQKMLNKHQRPNKQLPYFF